MLIARDTALGYDPKADYVLGRSETEVRRLNIQADILQPITERLVARIGIRSGMRVLDLGCGAGDVTMTVAHLVGPSGSVIGIDHDKNILAAAEKRVEAEELSNVTFREVPVETYYDSQLFDVVIGRLILFHQADPVTFLRYAAQLVRPGGYLALHEPAPLHGQFSSPGIPDYERACQAIGKAFKAGVPNDDVALRMAEHFSSAGLPEPELMCETPIGTGDRSSLYAWVAKTFRSLMPLMQSHGISGFEDIVPESLENTLREASVRQHSQMTFATMIGAWAQLLCSLKTCFRPSADDDYFSTVG